MCFNKKRERKNGLSASQRANNTNKGEKRHAYV